MDHALVIGRQDAHDCAEGIRERLPRRLQDLREAAGLSMYALAKRAGVSLEMLNQVPPHSICQQLRHVSR